MRDQIWHAAVTMAEQLADEQYFDPNELKKALSYFVAHGRDPTQFRAYLKVMQSDPAESLARSGKTRQYRKAVYRAVMGVCVTDSGAELTQVVALAARLVGYMLDVDGSLRADELMQ